MTTNNEVAIVDSRPVRSTIAELEQYLMSAQYAYTELRAESENASRRATEALNRLNDAQKAFDKGAADLKEKASPESDWRRQSRRITERA